MYGGSDKVFDISFTRQVPLTLRVDPVEPTVDMDALGHYQSLLDKKEDIPSPGEPVWVYSVE